MSWKTTILGAVGAITVVTACEAQRPPEQQDMVITPEIRKEVIDTAVKKLNGSYIFPETAKKMEAALRQHEQNKDYDGITSAKKLAETLTDHLQAVSHDKHLRVRYSYDPVAEEKENDEPTPAEREQMRKLGAKINYGFEKVERLPGNIGYLDLRGFFPATEAADTVTAAMNFLANSDALIIDLRKNGGGDPAQVALISTYLFGPETVHLNDLYYRPTDTTRQYWTLPYVPGKRLDGKDVYILTSKRTFSAAEEFTYNLKNLKRATIVGETTGGGAHPGGMERLSRNFAMFLPTGRAINPYSKTNWEGTGVAPDVPVDADKAMVTAQILASKKLMEKSTDAPTRAEFQRLIDQLEKDRDGVKTAGN
jgi:hypothetical protein